MDKIFSEKNIENKEYYGGIKNMINCLICLGIIQNPVQCSKCQNFFCSDCIKANGKCPFRCENNEFIKSITCSNLLSNLKFKCNCGEIVNYDDREKHLDNCTKKDYENLYLYYKEKCDELKKELKVNYTLKSSYFIKVSNHIHPIEIIRRYKHCWFCDHCDKTFNTDIPSYHCTLCDFDLCINCAKNFVKEGNVKETEQ